MPASLRSLSPEHMEAMHTLTPNNIAIGFRDVFVRRWDIRAEVFVSSFIEHSERINSIRFASNGRLLTSSSDKTASVIALDSKYVIWQRLSKEDALQADFMMTQLSSDPVRHSRFRAVSSFPA